MCIDNLVYCLAVQPIDNVAYKLSNLVKLSSRYKPQVLTIFE